MANGVKLKASRTEKQTLSKRKYLIGVRMRWREKESGEEAYRPCSGAEGWQGGLCVPLRVVDSISILKEASGRNSTVKYRSVVPLCVPHPGCHARKISGKMSHSPFRHLKGDSDLTYTSPTRWRRNNKNTMRIWIDPINMMFSEHFKFLLL